MESDCDPSEDSASRAQTSETCLGRYQRCDSFRVMRPAASVIKVRLGLVLSY